MVCKHWPQLVCARCSIVRRRSLVLTDPNQSFTEKLKELTAGNKIGGEEREMLSVLADAGSAAAHRGWKPAEDDIDHLMDALENFLERAFVLKHNIRRVKKNIPTRVGGH